MRNALAVSLIIAVLCPCIGVFLVLRRYSMIGDTLSHASLAGIALSLSVGGTPLAGAFVFTALCGALIEYLRSHIKNADLALSVVLALCVGAAVTIISRGGLNVSVEGLMFGSMLTVTRGDTLLALALCAASVLTLILLYDKMLFVAYDEEAAQIAGVRVKAFNYVFMVLTAAAISVAIRVVGVLVLSSMLALPVAAALQLGRGFKVTLVFSVIFSVIDILAGLILSYNLNVAPGGLTALVSVAVLLLVILAKNANKAMKRGKRI
jgi:zinc transport system permease protein